MLAENKFKNIFANSSPTHILLMEELNELFNRDYDLPLNLPFSRLKWDEVGRCEEVSVRVDEAIRVVDVRLVPNTLVHVDGVLQWENLQRAAIS